MSFLNRMDNLGYGLGQSSWESAEIKKVTSQITAEQNALYQCYQELGEYYYRVFRQENREELRSFVQRITSSMERIEQLQAEMQTLKGLVPCPSCGRMVPKNDLFCQYCGGKVLNRNVSVCNACGAVAAAGTMFCSNCGSKMEVVGGSNVPPEPSGKRCVQCGAVVEPNSSFCMACGAKIPTGVPKPPVELPPETPPVVAASTTANQDKMVELWKPEPQAESVEPQVLERKILTPTMPHDEVEVGMVELDWDVSLGNRKEENLIPESEREVPSKQPEPEREMTPKWLEPEREMTPKWLEPEREMTPKWLEPEREMTPKGAEFDHCPQCGEEVDDSQIFCGNCGYQLGGKSNT